MPLCEDYEEFMSSKLADIRNASTVPMAGSITAANFLSGFVPENCKWAHLDIAGSATVKGKHEESTGRPMGLLFNYLLAQAK
jgi:leucyl aminopeptidase